MQTELDAFTLNDETLFLMTRKHESFYHQMPFLPIFSFYFYLRKSLEKNVYSKPSDYSRQSVSQETITKHSFDCDY